MQTDMLQPQTAAMQSFADHIPMMPCDCNTQYCTCYSSNCCHVELCELDPMMLTSSGAQLSAHISGSTQNSQPFQHAQRRELRIFVMQQAALPTQYDKTAEMKHAVLNEAPPHDCLCSTVPDAMHRCANVTQIPQHVKPAMQIRQYSGCSSYSKHTHQRRDLPG